MNLKVFLATHDISTQDFSKMIDASYTYTTQLVNGKKFPSKRLLKDIVLATKGEVTASEIKEYYNKKAVKEMLQAAHLKMSESSLHAGLDEKDKEQDTVNENENAG